MNKGILIALAAAGAFLVGLRISTAIIEGREAVLRVAEDYDIPAKDGLIGMFKRKEVEFLEYTDILHGYTVPIDQISFIIAAEVEKGL